MLSVWALLAVPVLIALNAFFVAAEYAVVALRSSQVEMLRGGPGRLSGPALAALKGDMPSTLGTIQICITMMNLLLGWVGEPAMSGLLAWALRPLGLVLTPAVSTVLATALGFFVVTLATVVLSELVPKALTLQHTILVARVAAIPVYRIGQLLRPLVWLMNALANATTRVLGLGPVRIGDQPPSAEEIAVIAGEAGEAGVLGTRERSLILNALALGRRTAEQIMVPRHRVTYLDLQDTMEENLRRMEERLFSRLPLCDGGMDHVVGVVYTKEFFAAYEEAADSSVLQLIARPAVFAPSTITLDGLLAIFHEKRTHMAFLVDEYGVVEGIVTLTDVVDELIGEMHEVGEPAQPETTGGGSAERLVVPGDMALHELASRLGKSGIWQETAGVRTVGGLLSLRLGHIPLTGEEIEADGVRLRVVESDGRRVRQVEVATRTVQ